MTPTPALGQLQQVELRHVWPNEASDFTPWLAQSENLSLLGKTIEIELECEAVEKSVGPFSADILCKDVATGAWVLIENQLEKTDHSHLGQLLTYASGLQTVTIVWVAKCFTEEHRAALDWLNEITDKRFNFFGLELELWRIGDSRPAPKFNIVSKPNDWTKTVAQRARGELSESKQFQLRFWELFHDYVLEQGKPIEPFKPAAQSTVYRSLGRNGSRLVAVASLYDSENENYETHELRVEAFLDQALAKQVFAQLEAQKPAIEAEVGEPLAWQGSPESTCRIFLRRSANIADDSQWPEQHKWLLDKLVLFKKVFTPRIK